MIIQELLAHPPDAPAWIVDDEPTAVAAPGSRVHPRDVGDAAARIATVLAERGVARGTRCVVWLDGPTDVVAAYAALTALGAVPMLLSPHLPVSTIAAMIEGVDDVGAVVASGERFDAARTGLPGLEHVDWAAVAAEATGEDPVVPVGTGEPGDAPYVVFHTSGTTSTPKLAQYSSGGIDYHARLQAVIYRGARLGKGSCALALSPVHNRTIVAVHVALRTRARVILIKDHSPEHVADVLTRHRPVYLETHPNTFRSWQHLAPTGAFSSVRFFASGFDVIHPDTIEALLGGSARRLAVFVEVYGQTETGAIAWLAHPKGLHGRGSWRRSRAAGHCIGLRFPFNQVAIVDAENRPLPPGAEGRICVRTPGRFHRYLNAPTPGFSDARGDTWWDTGDQGSRSRAGVLRLVDRQVDEVTTVRSGIAVEDTLLPQFPELLELVVLEIDGVLQPVVSVRPGTSFRVDHWRDRAGRVAPMADPLVLADDELPRTATGKIGRPELRRRLTCVRGERS